MRRGDRQRLMITGVLVGVTVSLFQGWTGLAPVNEAASRVLAPVNAAVDRTFDGIGILMTAPRDVAQLRERLEALESENAELKVTNAKLGEVTRENDRLRELLDFKSARVDLDLIGASIEAKEIASEPGSMLHGGWLDVGTADGVEVDDPVATSRGLVGRVVQTHARSSQVRYIIDGDAAVGGRIERSQATGMVTGSPDGRLLLRYLPQNAQGQPTVVEVGDLVYTSGLSGATHFPRNLPIGQVVEVLQSDERPTQDAVVRPYVSFGDLDLVLVITDWRTDPVRTEPDPGAGSTAADG